MADTFSVKTRNSSGFVSLSLGEALSRPVVAAVVTGLVVLAILAVAGNFLVCRTIFRTSRLRTPPYFLISSLAAADFLVGLFVIPVALLYNVTFEMQGKWIFGAPLCDAWTFAGLWLSQASILSLCAVTWDRYNAVTSPLKYLARMRNTRTLKLICICWAASLVTAIVTTFGLKNAPNRILCEIQGLPFSYTVFNVWVFYLLPAMGILFVNCKIWSTASRHLNRVRAQENQVNHLTMSSVTGSAASLPSGQSSGQSLMRQIKTFRTFVIVIGAFLIAWTPFFVVLFMDRFLRVPGFVMYVAVILTYINSSTNPLIYSIFNKEFRRALFRSVRCRYSAI